MFRSSSSAPFQKWNGWRLTAPMLLALVASAQSHAILTSQTGIAAAEIDAALAAIREYASTYTKNLPNFTCTRLIRREITPARPWMVSGFSSFRDLIQDNLSFVDHKELHSLTSMDGTPIKDQLVGTFSRGEFGNLLESLFDPNTNATFHWDRFATRGGRRMYVFDFRVPQLSGYTLLETNRAIRVPYRGLIFADYETKAVMRIQLDCTGIPGDSEYKAVNLAIDYAPTNVAGEEFILPSRNELLVRKVDGDSRNEADYKSYRRFTSEATITYNSDPEVSPSSDTNAKMSDKDER
jgi:hypothetical protein